MHTSLVVVPSLPAESFGQILTLAQSLEGVASEIQIDIVDGFFAPTCSWPFTEEMPEKKLERIVELPKTIEVEMDCMVMEPEKYLDLFVSLQVKRVIVHMGSTKKYKDIIKHARVHGYAVGIAFTNNIPLADVEPYICDIDFVQVMGIKTVGKQGQPFDMRTLTTVEILKKQYPHLEIAVDGSVNRETIIPLREVGVTRFAPGSAIAQAEDPRDAYEQLVALVEGK